MASRHPTPPRAARRPAARRGTGAAGQVGRRQRLSTDARRRQLIETAMRVFAEFGFSGATTRRIAEAAGVTEAVIFQHFPDKDALYAAILAHKTREARTDDWLASLEDLQARGDDAGVLRAIFERLIGRHEQDPHCLRLMVYSALENHALARGMQEAQSRRLIRFVEGFVLAGQRAKRFRPGSPAVFARAILGLPVYHVFQMRLFRSASEVNRQELIELGVAYTLAGLAVPARVAADGRPGGARSWREPQPDAAALPDAVRATQSSPGERPGSNGADKEHTC